MKKISNFVVNSRYFILIIFLILTVLSLMIYNKVNINYDISKYLPSSSETKIGMDIMENEFDSKTSTLNIMLKDLTNNKLDESYEYLKNLDGIDNVNYFLKDSYTLFTITINYSADSIESRTIYNDIKEYFDDSLVDTSGDVSQYNKTVLPFYIILLAVLSALVILVIMCESYVEPFLFLITILIAVALNSGTNIIFSSVSNITSSICSILQMALSMDYSIMLMNRYRQERSNEGNKVDAMKKALYNSFKAISSSSVTTIVGLIALVFMSFTIGRDLGFVLAKGVLFSLLSIFTVLPCLILMFDKLIIKTKKKSPIIKLNSIGSIVFKCRYIGLILFVVIFIASYFLRGNLDYIYTSSGTDEIEKVFNLNNQMAIIYNNKDESKVSKYCSSLNDKNINEVLCYGNTINLPLVYYKLNDKFNELGESISIDDYLLKLVYYHYYNESENNKIKLNDLINFIKGTVYSNNNLNKTLDEVTKNNIDLLNNFTDINKLQQARTIKEISQIFNLDEDTIRDLLVYNNSKNISNEMTIYEFINFINNYILSNDRYKDSIDDMTIKSLNKISVFLDKSILNKKINFNDMSNILGIDVDTIKNLYTYYLINSEINEKISLHEFSTFTNKVLSSEIDDSFKDNLNTLITFSDYEFINNKMSSLELSNLFNVDESTINMLFQILFSVTDKVSPYEFVSTVINNEIIYNSLKDKKEKLQTLYFIMESTNNYTKYTYQEVSEYFNIPISTTKEIYSLYLSDSFKMSPYEFVMFILSDSSLTDSIDSNTLSNLKQLKNIMDGVLSDKKYTTDELANLLNISKDNLSLIYSLYDVQNKELTISCKEFVNLLVNDILNNNKYKDNFDEYSKNRLMAVSTVIKDTLVNKKYTKDEVYNLLKQLSEDLDKNLIDLVYIYYGSEKEYNDTWTLTIEEFSNYLNNNIIKDNRFDIYIDEGMKNNILDSKDKIKKAKELLIGKNYSRVVLNTNLLPESNKTFSFIQNINDNLSKEVDDFYIIGDSKMAYEMSKSFSGELNLITILTMIFIFIVVVVTFKSILIPIILVLLIECAVFVTMGILSFGGPVYFISILIVQSILMGATIDYAILYTSYYLESRQKEDIKTSIINAYNNSIHTILTSSLILIIVTFIVGKFSNAIAAKICMTLSEGTICSAILILVLLPMVLAACDKFIVKKK